MRLLTFETKDKVGQHVAEHVVQRINEFNPTKERPFVIGASPAVSRGAERAGPAALPSASPLPQGCRRARRRSRPTRT